MREGNADDIPQINTLFASVFGRRRDDAATRWRLFHNPAGPPVMMVAEAAGRIIAHRAFWPIDLRIGERRVRGAQSIDLMVHAAYRRRGVFSELAPASFVVAERRGLELLYGFPNRYALRASARLGWNHIGNVPQYSRPLRGDAFHRLPSALRPFADLAVRVWPQGDCGGLSLTLERPSNEDLVALLAHRTSSIDATCETARSPSWYDWRFSPLCDGRYEWVTLHDGGSPAAFAVWGQSHDGRTARLAEVVGTSRSAVSAAVASVVGRARNAGCSSLEALTTRGDVTHALSINGFRNVGLMPFRVKATSSRQLALAHSFPRWQLSGCDFDVF